MRCNALWEDPHSSSAVAPCGSKRPWLARFPLSLKELHTPPQKKQVKQALCPPVERENYCAKFESESDPPVDKWKLEQLLEKADHNLAVEAKSALLSQFMCGLPNSIRGKQSGVASSVIGGHPTFIYIRVLHY